MFLNTKQNTYKHKTNYMAKYTEYLIVVISSMFAC